MITDGIVDDPNRSLPIQGVGGTRNTAQKILLKTLLREDFPACMRSNIIHITGTDTEIGKTTMASMLVQALCKQGLVPWVMKPVQTGCEEDENGHLVAPDAVQLWQASGKRQKLSEVNFRLYRSPVAPLVAAQLEGETVPYQEIKELILDSASKHSLVIFEGAGGVFVPLTEEKTFLDLAKELRCEALVVVGSRLGALNHACLTFHALRSFEISSLGYVFNDLFSREENYAADSLFFGDAIRTNRKLLSVLARRFGFEEQAYVPFLEPKERERMAHQCFGALAERIISGRKGL